MDRENRRRQRDAYARLVGRAALAQAGTAAGLYLTDTRSRKRVKKTRTYKPIGKKMYQKKKQTLKKKVQSLERKVNQDFSTHTYRSVDSGYWDVPVNASECNAHIACDLTTLEAALANLRYFNPATNALVTAAASTGTYSREVYFQSIYTKFTARNNYRVPVKIAIYCVVPRKDTDLGAYAAFTQGLTDQGGPLITSPVIYPTDSDLFNSLYEIVSSKKMLLGQGKSCSLSFSKGTFQYDPSVSDSHNLDHQRKYGAHQYFVRLEGVIAHDTSAAERTIAPGGIDYMVKHTYKIRYDAGKKLNDISLANNMNTGFTTAEQVGIPVNSSNHQFSKT